VGSNICTCKPGFSGDGNKCFGKTYQFILYINPQANKVLDSYYGAPFVSKLPMSID